ncbi:cytochrome c-type biogenesis protein [Mangrovicella endophytica]|uniref:cytochrome c-type biogenesis protein n=1 Tax=Mangrovicella endophytica TaxID=2066697 RepID=UPI000C9EB9DE|nr:cytochrome c-type biogenesis protein [Mangrovicella endophytica]
MIGVGLLLASGAAAPVGMLAPQAAFAVNPDEVLADPALEARARALSAGLRCLVCQNQSIDDSNADLARDLRLLVRQRLAAGDTDEQVIAYLVDRYGDFVLLRPPLQWDTMLLWAAPAAILLAGVAAAWLATRRSGRREVERLDAAEEAALAKAVDGELR